MIHLVGAGSIGLLHAHFLAKNQKVVSLILRSPPSPLQAGRREIIKYTGIGASPTRTETSECILDDAKSPISTLLMTTKAYDGLKAFKSIQHRLSSQSNIILLSNGVLKLYSEIQQEISNSQGIRPSNFLLGLTSHGAVRKDDGAFSISHTGFGKTSIGLATELFNHNKSSESKSDVSTETIKELRKDLDTAWKGNEALSFTWLENSKILQRELLLKLAINACINPLAALFDVKNGGLIGNANASMIMLKVCEEFLEVFQEEELLDPNNGNLLSPSSLHEMAINVALRTKENKNSMLVDISSPRRRKTEIDFINGYIVDEAVRRQAILKDNGGGIRSTQEMAPVNSLLRNLILAKSSMKRDK